jgi:hypothetical protein
VRRHSTRAEDKRSVGSGYPYVQLIAEAIAAFQNDNNRRQEAWT